MPLIWENDNILIAKNEVFYTAPRHLRGSNTFLNKMKYFGTYNLTNDYMKELNSLHPGFILNIFINGQKPAIMLIHRGETI